MSYDIEDIKDQLEDGEAQLLDVREQDEWDAGHLSQAKFAPLSLLRDGECDEKIDKSLKTYIHCRSGRRVLEAAPLLENLGFKDVTPLEEGFESLMAEGFSIGS
jgi:rhodanese-related sulfurtransferase